VNPLVQVLLDLLVSWKPAPGTSSQDLRDLLRAQAAVRILDNPAEAVLPPGDFDPIIVEAISAGAEQAATVKAARSHLRLAAENLPFGTSAADLAEHRSERFGPFVEPAGRLRRFFTTESPTFLRVSTRQPAGPPEGELLLLVPALSAPVPPDTRSWALPAGTVWLQSRFLVAGGENFTGVRIAGGTLTFDRDVVRHGAILVPRGTQWTLSVELEQPGPADLAGSDANALNLQLPARLEVSSQSAPQVSGDAALSGFGSDLHLSPSGTAFLDGNQICFPLAAAEPAWSIAGNRSRVTQFSGQSTPGNACWALPVSKVPSNQLAEAAHGGSIVFSLAEGLTSIFAAQDGGPFRWFVSTVTANATALEIQALQPDSAARYDLELWAPALTKLRFAGQPIARVLFRSERDGTDTVVAVGGACSNAWDQPRRADGPPFDFDGSINVFGLLSTPTSFLMTLIGTAPAGTELAGFALENLYLVVRSPRKLAVLAPFDEAPVAPAGTAVLLFDVNLALPTLPDPYASNLVPPDGHDVVDGALRVRLPWTDGQAPALEAHLDAAVRFPEPRFDLLDDEDERAVYQAFQDHLEAQPEFLRLLDVSSNAHLFGVALESPSDHQPALVDNRLSLQMNRMRLLMQPQVQWEPVQVEPMPDAIPPVAGSVAHSLLNGGPTLVGANSVKLVPALPASLSADIVDAIADNQAAAALFSLPFGLRAMVNLDFVKPNGGADVFTSAADTVINQPSFGDLSAARQLRLSARSRNPAGDDPSRVMPGIMRQLANLGEPPKLTSVLSELRDPLNEAFGGVVPPRHQPASQAVPLHQADLSGYGLSTFSEWHRDTEGAGFTKVEFRVLNGRTAYEVIQFRSILFECGARVVRTVILERHNTGRVVRIDTGWVAIDAGLFLRPAAFQKGVVKSFQNIRRIRIVGEVFKVGAAFSVQPVIFDADADIEGAHGGRVAVHDRPGYVQISQGVADATDLKLLFEQVHAIHSPIDCSVRVAGTLEIQLLSIASDVALDDGGGIGFAVAVVGAPKLPRAGQWTAVRIDPVTRAVSPIDPRRGVPLVRDGAGPFRFREPADACRKDARVEYALLMATESSRALFRKPKLEPGRPGTVLFEAAPVLADPYSLVQATGSFPGPNGALELKEIPSFQVTADNLWRIDNETFTVANTPLGDLMKGGGWGMTRAYEAGGITLGVDSGLAAAFNVAVPPSLLNLELPAPLGNIIQIRTQYQHVAGGLAKLADPDLVFQGALEELTKTLDSLSHLLGLRFHFDVSVTGGSGASPSFLIHLRLLFRIGDGPDGRVEIGIGKFYGQFLVEGALEAALSGVERALLFIEFQGDVQQGILPPLLYAGGLFRFSVELREKGGPVIQLTLGVVISIGGDLIPGLLAVEATIKYGYSLIPESLQPGILLGLEARAKLLGGLIGFSFSVEAMARLKRKDQDPTLVTVWAQLRIAASVHIAIFLDEDIDFETQFEQDIPLAAVALLPGVGMAVVAAGTLL
jgi:hypothetical protein